MNLLYFIMFAEDIIQAYDFVTLFFNLKSKYNHENPGKEEKYCGVGPAAFHIDCYRQAVNAHMLKCC